jgi:hypothetical protein
MPAPDSTRATDPETRLPPSAEAPSPGLLREFVDFVRYNKLWWITPIAIVLLCVGSLLFLAPTWVAPFIYTMVR